MELKLPRSTVASLLLVTYFRHKDRVDALDLMTVAKTFVGGGANNRRQKYSPTSVLFSAVSGAVNVGPSSSFSGCWLSLYNHSHHGRL